MSKAFSLASWNVHNLSNDPARVGRVVDFLGKQDPDVFALYEVKGDQVFSMMVKRLPDYQFHITEGQETQEILVGARGGISAFFTQKTEFKSGNLGLRPGALLTVTVGGQSYPILFLHTKSSSKPVGLGIRDDQFERAFKFRSTLAKAAPDGRPNYIFLGDLNTMGMEYPYQRDIPYKTELQKLGDNAAKTDMKILPKNPQVTWWGGGTSLPPSDLDQVVAADHVQISGGVIEVRGWPGEPTTAAKKKWIKDYSDHGLLYMEVQ